MVSNYWNVDIFACINFRGFMKFGNFACIKIRVLCIIGSIGYNKRNFRGVHIQFELAIGDLVSG